MNATIGGPLRVRLSLSVCRRGLICLLMIDLIIEALSLNWVTKVRAAGPCSLHVCRHWCLCSNVTSSIIGCHGLCWSILSPLVCPSGLSSELGNEAHPSWFGDIVLPHLW